MAVNCVYLTLKTHWPLMEQGKIRIIIVDDHKIIRQTWKLILQQDRRFDIIAECSNGAEAIKATESMESDIILMDINMHPVNGFEATKKIMKQKPSTKIIGISVNNQPSYARNMLHLGAKGFVTKDSTKEEMVEAILTVYNGGKFLSEDVRRYLHDDEKNRG
ncbi:MAG TPA: response regulator transcription factor [Chitinophagaceae bacterium]